MKAALDALFSAAGCAGWGHVSYSLLSRHMTPAARAQVENRHTDPRSVLVSAFPYFAGHRPGNLSLYARGEDYHRVLPRLMSPICNYLQNLYPEDWFSPAADTSPLPERQTALLAGLGLVGENGLCIVPPYGSFVFLGTILTSAALDLPAAPPSPGCGGCGACLSACPTGALTAGGVSTERCRSHLTQKKGAFTPSETACLQGATTIWGCDLCQTACPHNADPVHSAIPAFIDDLVDGLAAPDVAGLNNRAFGEKYGQRAFSWRGPGPLKRALDAE